MPQENPFQDPLRFRRRVPECIVVIFGANGDLTSRMLAPAFYRLACERRLPPGFAVIGNSRTPMADDQFRDKLCTSVAKHAEDTPFDPGLWSVFAQSIFYVPGDVNDPSLYARLAARLNQIADERHTGGNVLFYLATQPSYYEAAVRGIGQAGLNRGSGWRRLIVEKPFGHDLASARQLSGSFHEVFPESEIYRIDHYLGKETVQNILAFRFGNGIFEPLWNRRYVNHVQITAAEAIGIEGRGAYYQEAGALRDMVQNHLLQVMATVAMEPSATFRPNSVRDERSKLIRSIHILKRDEVAGNAVPGQYDGFRSEPGVDPESQTETYAALTFLVDNWRWAGVPFYVRTGKRLARRVTEIAIQFNAAPLKIFDGEGTDVAPNLLLLRIQPEEGISLKFLSKRPGTGMRLRPVSMDFNYGTSFGERSPSAYETLLIDAMAGDPTLYTRQDMVEASWAAVEPVLEVWSQTKFPFPNYAPGTWGPAEADRMLARRGHTWRRP